MSRRSAAPVAGPLSPAVVLRTLLRDLTADHARTGHRQLMPADVHLTRKRIKRARAALALLRPALDEGDFDDCDRSLRDAGRSMAAARDAAVMTRTYARMRARAMGSPRPAETGNRRITADDPPGAAVDGAAAHRHVGTALERLDRARLTARGWAPLGRGVRGVYRRGRRRRPRESHPATEAVHAWRRHSKRYWHVLELFEAVNPERLAPAITDARRLSDLLGEEHDLALLAERLCRSRGRVDRAILALVADRRARLTRRALRLGAKVYEDPPKVVERRLRIDWERWRRARRAQTRGAGVVSD